MIAKRFLFFGHVQGVGFRFTTAETLRDLPLSGLVRNLEDGSVELFLQGEPPAIQQGLDRIRKRWESNLDRIQDSDAIAKEHLSGIMIVK